MMTALSRLIGALLIVLAGSLIIKHWNAYKTIVHHNILYMLEWASVMAGIVLIITARWDMVGISMLVLLPIIIIATVLQVLVDYFHYAQLRILENWIRKAREKGNNGAIVKICEQVAAGIRRGMAIRRLQDHKNPNENGYA